MSEPAPLPPAQADPAVQAGLAAQQAYNTRMAEIQADPGLDDLGRTEATIAAYEQQTATVQQLGEDLHNRRVARFEHLRSRIPNGPGVTPGTSPADAAVLNTAFRTSLEQARNVGLNERRQMLDDAIRFGDDTMIRAVLTAAQEKSETGLVEQWAQATGNSALIDELRALNEDLSGVGPNRGWVSQALRPPARPNNEYANLTALRQRAEEAARDAAERRRTATPVYNRY